MHGSIRRLINPPASSREVFAALDAAKVDGLLHQDPYTIIEAQGVSHEPGALRVTTYDAITLNRAVVAVHCTGHTASNIHEPVRFVLWFDPVEAALFASAITKNARLVQQHEDGKQPQGIANGDTQH